MRGLLLAAGLGLLAIAGGGCAPMADDDATIEFLNSGQLPPGLPFSEAVRVGNLVFLSGQLGNPPGQMQVVPGGIEAEARQTMENIRTVLEAHGLSLRDLIKCTVMLEDMGEWPAFNEVYRSFFEPPYPARSALGTSGLALGARVEVECIAAIGRRVP